MPRASTLVLILAAVVLTAFGFTGIAPFAVLLALGLEFTAWKREADRLAALREARIVARPSRYRRR
jgi:hypothetical protein